MNNNAEKAYNLFASDTTQGWEAVAARVGYKHGSSAHLCARRWAKDAGKPWPLVGSGHNRGGPKVATPAAAPKLTDSAESTIRVAILDGEHQLAELTKQAAALTERIARLRAALDALTGGAS